MCSIHSIEENPEAVGIEVAGGSAHSQSQLLNWRFSQPGDFFCHSPPLPQQAHTCPATQTSPNWQHLCALVCCFSLSPFSPPIIVSSSPSPVAQCSFKMTFTYQPLNYIIILAAHHSCPGSLTEISMPRPDLNGSDLFV